jgi:hypothetical protein
LLIISVKNENGRTMKVILNIIIISLAITTAFNCRNNLTGSQTSEPQPGRRDYVWTLDTLNMPVNYLSAIWGALPNDVWAVGAGGTYNDRLQHYDGKKWSAYNKEAILCEGSTLYGFAENNVWMGGESDNTPGATIWHYDGNQWTRNFDYNVNGAYSVEVTDIWGLQSNNIFACGTIVYPGSYPGGYSDSLQGFVLHFDGNGWRELARGDLNYQFLMIRSEYATTNILFNQDYKSYIFGYKLSNVSDDSARLAFYELDADKLRKIYSNTVGNIGWVDLAEINGGIYFLISRDVYEYINENFVKVFSLGSPNFTYRFFGRNIEDIFLYMSDGIAHYNGSDIEYLYNFTNKTISFAGTPLILNSDVFIGSLSENGNEVKNIILHGKLNN